MMRAETQFEMRFFCGANLDGTWCSPVNLERARRHSQEIRRAGVAPFARPCRNATSSASPSTPRRKRWPAQYASPQFPASEPTARGMRSIRSERPQNSRLPRVPESDWGNSKAGETTSQSNLDDYPAIEDRPSPLSSVVQRVEENTAGWIQHAAPLLVPGHQIGGFAVMRRSGNMCFPAI
jgi:hypothetical protein